MEITGKAGSLPTNMGMSPLRQTMEAKRQMRAPTGAKLTGEHGLHWERPKFHGGLRYPGGYCGHIMPMPDPEHALEVPMKRSACLGYSAFRPGKKEIIGKPIVSLAEERGDGEATHTRKAMATRGLDDPFSAEGKEALLHAHALTHAHGPAPVHPHDAPGFDIREMWKNVDIEERYKRAKLAVERDGHNEAMLVEIVQAKLASRVNSYAEQHKKVRLIFESFDLNGDGVLDEEEFRQCLERMNIQCSDDQVLTLFAYFDTERCGLIRWENFQKVAMVPNPKGGTAVLPKVITQRCTRTL